MRQGRVAAGMLAVLCLMTAIGCQLGQVRQSGGYEKIYFPQTPPPAEVVDLVDLSGADKDIALAAATLQGLINRGDEAKVFLLRRPADSNQTPDHVWIDWFKKRGYIRETRTLSLAEYFAKYNSVYDKVILYDMNLPASINIATMKASVENAIVVSFQDIAKFTRGKKVEDLTGKWKSNVEAYRWAWKHLRPKMNRELVSIYHPNFNGHYLTDYLVQNRVFTMWVTGKNVENNVISDYESEKALFEEVLAGFDDNIPIIGWWGAVPDHGLTEYYGVGLAGEYGKITLGCDWTSNLSFLSGMEVDVASAVAAYHSRAEQTVPPLEQDKVYVCYTINDSGDAPGYWMDVEHDVWKDEKRGQVPIGWSLAPATWELMPGVLEWFFRNATGADHFYVGISGNGYVHPYRNLFGKTENPARAWKQYLYDTGWYMDFLDLKVLGLYTYAWKDFVRSRDDAITQKFIREIPNLEMLVMGLGRDDNALEIGPNYMMGEDREVVVSHVVTRWDAANIGRSAANNQWLADEIKTHTPAERPAFITVHPLSWSYFPSDLAAVQKMLGPGYVAVSPHAFHELYLQNEQAK